MPASSCGAAAGGDWSLRREAVLRIAGSDDVVGVGRLLEADRLAGERGSRAAVEAVEVAVRLQLAVLVDARRHVGDVHRDVLGERDLAAAGEHALHLLRRPALVLGEQNLGQAARLVHAHAAVAERAERLAEQVPLRRVVHVDVMRVGEQELHVAEHILRARRLLEAEAADVDAAPVDRVGIDLAAVGVGLEIVGVEHGLRRVAAAEDAEEEQYVSFICFDGSVQVFATSDLVILTVEPPDIKDGEKVIGYRLEFETIVLEFTIGNVFVLVCNCQPNASCIFLNNCVNYAYVLKFHSS